MFAAHVGPDPWPAAGRSTAGRLPWPIGSPISLPRRGVSGADLGRPRAIGRPSAAPVAHQHRDQGRCAAHIGAVADLAEYRYRRDPARLRRTLPAGPATVATAPTDVGTPSQRTGHRRPGAVVPDPRFPPPHARIDTISARTVGTDVLARPLGRNHEPGDQRSLSRRDGSPDHTRRNERRAPGPVRPIRAALAARRRRYLVCGRLRGSALALRIGDLSAHIGSGSVAVGQQQLHDAAAAEAGTVPPPPGRGCSPRGRTRGRRWRSSVRPGVPSRSSAQR